MKLYDQHYLIEYWQHQFLHNVNTHLAKTYFNNRFLESNASGRSCNGCILSWWIKRPFLVTNFSGHMEHWKGFSPVCWYMWY
ncbi:hypothetical protein O3G_MSEX015138 [Manduca sexta]|uniref:Uncharacterized protein n=1 Tax=Manduca sexta TaxID=7130 RepID=A0A921ZXV7_MANSE|nr:hypothetical protein O3G_MSEX015138 [Manduca sexta]KAG6465419.1 hypothetical protein O3G_MSEX015138 [Manduca sexta]